MAQANIYSSGPQISSTNTQKNLNHFYLNKCHTAFNAHCVCLQKWINYSYALNLNCFHEHNFFFQAFESVDPSLRTETNFAVFIQRVAEARDFLSTWAMALVNSFADSQFLYIFPIFSPFASGEESPHSVFQMVKPR